MRRLKEILPTTKGGALIILVLLFLYVAIFHVVYKSYRRPTDKKRFSAQNAFSKDLLNLWKERSNQAHVEDETRVGLLIEQTDSEGDATKYRDHYSHSSPKNNLHRPTVAVGGGLTSKGLIDVNETNLASKFQLFFTFIPSFCKTASQGFEYHFYFAYDSVDIMFINESFLRVFEDTFLNATETLCPGNLRVNIHMVQCNHSEKPTWAQNDAMLEAYLDNMEYFYRINDDTQMITSNWTESFIKALRDYNPANVGVVGPNHSGGNTGILTYDFVHRTHVDIFGFYYPRLFTDWWGDTWITTVYEPYRSTKLMDVQLFHTLGLGRRYGVNTEVQTRLKYQLNKDQRILMRYINYTRTKDSIKVDGRKVISMSLYGSDPKYTWGAIRNAQIAPIFFPGWKLRIYVTSQNSKAADVKSWLVPKRILNKLRQLGAEIAYVKTMSIPPVFWRYLVVDDNSVDYFIIRNAHSRLSERDAIVVNDWIDHQDPKSEANSLHCIRDHPTHTNRSIVDGLWGANRVMIRHKLGQSMSILLDMFHGKTNESSHDQKNLIHVITKSHRSLTTSSFGVLEDIVWPLMVSESFCHDSVSCNGWPNTHDISVQREPDDYLGRPFDEHEEPILIKEAISLTNFQSYCRNSSSIYIRAL